MIRAFLSFVEEDLDRVNLFRGQAKNENVDLEFADCSVKEPYDSTNAAYIRSQIRPSITGASLLVCLYGPTTYRSKWVEWELSTGIELGKPAMGVSLYGDGRTKYHPAQLEGRPRVGWNINEIVQTMRQLVR